MNINENNNFRGIFGIPVTPFNTNDSLDDTNIKRLGSPGRQGTTIKISCEGKDYAMKITQKGQKCESDRRGFYILRQARLQELAAQYNITPHVHAVFCGNKKKRKYQGYLSPPPCFVGPGNKGCFWR